LAKDESHSQLQPLTGPPPAITLSPSEQARFDSGQAVFKTTILADAKRAAAIFKVNASPGKIWAIIRNFQSYPKWIDGVMKTDIYHQSDNLLSVRFEANHWLLGTTVWYAEHDYPQLHEINQRNWGSWVLDTAKDSDFEDLVGFWQVKAMANKPNISQVIYSVDLRFKGKFANLFRRSAIRKTLKQATQWVKVQAES
jgi:ribosome-associated toxin RatA of RatAB toxin-antitoxin module